LFCGPGCELLLLLRGTLGFIAFSHINLLLVLRGHKVYVVTVKLINDIKIQQKKTKKYKCIEPDFETALQFFVI